MEFEGMIYRILPVVKGQGAKGEWTKQEVVFELPGEFNRKLCVTFWGDKAQEVASFREGDVVSVSINLESREHNGRWFTEARAWRISRKSAGAPAASAQPPYGTSEEFGAPLPAGPLAASQAAPMPSAAEAPLPAGESDDLPF